MLERIAAIIPVTPVALASAALLSFDRESVTTGELLARMTEYQSHLLESHAKVVGGDRPIEETWDRAMMMFRMRHTVHVEHGRVLLLSRERPLLEYYANSIRHLLPAGAGRGELILSPAMEHDRIDERFRLTPWEARR
jgi:glycerol-3-phosphate O-acyltransferase